MGGEILDIEIKAHNLLTNKYSRIIFLGITNNVFELFRGDENPLFKVDYKGTGHPQVNLYF